jgi:hypothetical protein
MRHHGKHPFLKMASVVPFLPIILFFASCERRTEVTITGGNPPTFLINGSGELGEVIITKPVSEQTKNFLDKENVLWQITAVHMPGEPVEVVRSVTYGIVPKSYKQSIPENGSPPPLLETEKRYGFLFVTADAPLGAGYFEIRNGKALSVNGR